MHDSRRLPNSLLEKEGSMDLLSPHHVVLLYLKIMGGSSMKYDIHSGINRIPDWRLGFKFKSTYRGPRSTTIQEGIDELLGAGFVRTNRVDGRYYIVLTSQGSKLADILAGEHADMYDSMRKGSANYGDR
jgi:hypothetical protein